MVATGPLRFCAYAFLKNPESALYEITSLKPQIIASPSDGSSRLLLTAEDGTGNATVL